MRKSLNYQTKFTDLWSRLMKNYSPPIYVKIWFTLQKKKLSWILKWCLKERSVNLFGVDFHKLKRDIVQRV